ncbi:ras-related protein Rab-24 isoform X2 [Augochlora pura]
MDNVDFKTVLIGDKDVGKTSLVTRYIHEIFTEEVRYRNTIGAAFLSKTVICNGVSIKLGIWDTAGSERFEAMTRMYYRGAQAAIVCFDVTRAVTFQRAKFWIRELRKYEDSCKIYICATKMDLLNLYEVQFLDMGAINNYATSIRAKFYMTSSELFDAIVQDFAATNPVKRTHDACLLTSTVPMKKHSRCC